MDVRVEFTKGPGDGRRIAQELQWKELDAIFIAGGDGTVHEVSKGQGFDFSKISLGLCCVVHPW